MNVLRAISLFFVLLGLTGCTLPMIKGPLGSKSAPAEDLVGLAGQWTIDGKDDGKDADEETYFTLTVVDAAAGKVRLDVTPKNEEPQSLELFIRMAPNIPNGIGPDWYVTLPVDADDREGEYIYTFARARLGKNIMVLWGPDTDFLTAAVKDGKLQADLLHAESSAASGKILLNDAAALEQFLSVDDGADAFTWSQPIVLVRR